MSRTRAALILLAALALAGCAAAPVAPGAPAMPRPRAELPTYAVGERWFRTPDGVLELIRIEEDRYVFAASASTQFHLTKSLGVARSQRGMYFQEFDPPIQLRWPLEVGKWGSSQGRWKGHWSSTGDSARFSWRVDAYEDVDVAAGTFKAFRISFSVRPQWATRRTEWTFDLWYAPEARQFVKGYGDEMELLSFGVFHVPRPAPAELRITLDQPREEARAPSEAITLTGKVTAGSGVARVTVTLNGQEVATQGEREAPKEEIPLRVPITLREGRNVLLVTAADILGNTRQEARTLVYDPGAARAAAEALRQSMLAARDDAANAEAERLAPALWAPASAQEREAEAALARQDFPRAEAGYREVQQGYEGAAREARRAAGLAEHRAETRRLQDEAAEARRTAEVADAARLAAAPWARATAAQREAEVALTREDFDAAQARFREAQQAYRDAAREAQQHAAATAEAERQRLATLRRQLEATERIAATTAAARREAEQTDAPRYAPRSFGAAQETEQQGHTALDRRDFATAQARFRDAQQAYQRATQEARRAAEAERREAALQAQRQREAEQARDQLAQARAEAERAEARRWAPERWAAAAATEAEGQAALGRREFPQAQQRFRDARQAYEQAAVEARKAVEAALPPLQVALAAPRDQLRVEQDVVGLAGVVSSGKGVRRVLVTLDGVEIGRVDEPTPQRSLALNLPVKLREGHNTLVVTATDAAGMIQQEVRTVHYEKLVPLTIAFRYPDSGARFTDDASVAAAVVTSSKGVARVAVTLNGAPVLDQTERTPQRSVAVTVPVTLRDGTNTIVLTAAEPDGTARQEVRTVTYERPTSVAAAAGPPVPPDRWAVVIGAGRYENPDVPRLRYTVPDAEAIYQVLVGPAGFKKDHVLLLTDETERKPTLRNIKWALGTFLARSAAKDDTVVIFFAGHGAPEIDPRGLERDGFAKYLVPLDADPDDLYSSALPMDEINTIFNRIEAERVVVFLDTCYSGAAGGRTFASKKTRAAQVDEEFLTRLTRAKGRVIVTAARPNEVSIELAELRHGLFTYHLVHGLRGGADLDRDGIVTLQELYQLVEREVSQHSRAAGANQHPVMKGELEGVLPLVKVPR